MYGAFPPSRIHSVASQRRIASSAKWATFISAVLRIVDRFVIGWKDDLQQLAVIRPTENRVANTRRLDPARTFLHGVHPSPIEFALEPALEHIHELEFDVVMVALAQLLSERRNHADHM